MDNLIILEKIDNYIAGTLSPEEINSLQVWRNALPENEVFYRQTLYLLENLEKRRDTESLKLKLKESARKASGGSQLSGRLAFIKPLYPLWKSHRKTIAVAASVAILFSTLSVSVINMLYNSAAKNATLKPLVEKIKQQDHQYKKLKNQVDRMASDQQTEQQPILESNFRATGFLFDVRNNLILTNAHVLDEAPHQIAIENSDGYQFSANPIFKDREKDIAVLQINDPAFRSLPPLPFNLRKNKFDLGESVFTLGFPKQEIVYGEGYVSAQNGYEMDSSFCQLSISANEGSSGSPVISLNGDLIGMVASKETTSQGVVFATKSKSIQEAIDSIRKIPGYNDVRFTGQPSLKRNIRVNQIKKISSYIFMVKGN